MYLITRKRRGVQDSFGQCMIKCGVSDSSVFCWIKVLELRFSSKVGTRSPNAIFEQNVAHFMSLILIFNGDR